MTTDLQEYIATSDLHQKALALLPGEFTQYADLRDPIEVVTGYDYPFDILTDLVEAGLAEREIHPLYSIGGAPRGALNSFRRVQP
jgi:hypothetical protein